MATPINTIEDIRARRAKLRVELDKQGRRLQESYRTLTAPAPEPTGRASRFVQRAQNFTYVFDAALLGFKLYRTFQRKPLRRLFR